MADVTLGGERTVKVITPAVPTFKATRPTPAGPVLVVPVAGPPGAPGGSRYEYTQTTPASSWTISHNKGTYPPATVFLDDDPTRAAITDTEYPDANTVILVFPTPTTGRAYL